jgi:hypothetical protein
MSTDFQQPKSLAEDSIVPRILEILQSHDLFPDGLEGPTLSVIPTLASYQDLHNEVSLHLRREHSAGPVIQAMLTTREDNEIISIEECYAITIELDGLMVTEGQTRPLR